MIEVEVADHPVQPEIVPSIVVDHADIRYRVYEEPQLSARKLVSRGFRSRRAVTVHAVKDVSFTVGVGEAVPVVIVLGLDCVDIGSGDDGQQGAPWAFLH